MIHSVRLAVVAALLVAASGFPSASPAAAAAPPDCPETMPIAEVEAGMSGTGYSVVRGEAPRAFEVEVLGTFPHGVAPDHGLILVRVRDEEGSTFIKDAGGIWAGMSGSPVVIDGKLIGAISYGFSGGPSTFGGVTPIAEMVKVANRPGMVAAGAPLDLSKAAERAIDRVAPAAAGSLERLPVPVVSTVANKIRTKGVRAPKRVARLRQRAQLSTALRRAGLLPVRTVAARAARRAAIGAPIGSGDDIALTLATGDALAAAIGTVTWTCGDKLVALGHPLLGDGASNLGAHHAKAIDVVEDPVNGAFHLALPGELVGRVAEDRLTGVGVRLDQEPRGVLHVTSTTTDGPDSRDGSSRISATSSMLRTALVALHARANVVAVSEAEAEGSVSVTLNVRGRRDNDAPFEVTFGDRLIATDGPIGEFYTVAEAAEAAAGMWVSWLDLNGVEDVSIDRVDMAIDVGAPARWVIQNVLVRKGNAAFRPLGGRLVAKAGTVLTVRFQLAKSTARGSWTRPGPNAEQVTQDIVITVPRTGGTITAGAGSGLDIIWFDPTRARTFDALLRTLASRTRTDELFVTIGSTTQRLRLGRIIDGPLARAKVVR